MVRKTSKSDEGIIYIPVTENIYPKIRIIVIDNDSTSYTMMNTVTGASTDNFTLKASITRPVTERLGSFNLSVANDNGRFINKFSGGEIVKIYADYTDATNLLFYGRVDNAKYGLNKRDGFFIEFNGRDYPELIDKTITGQEAAAPGYISLAGILYEYFNDVKLQFWNGSSWSTATYTESTDSVEWSPAVTNFPGGSITMGYQHKKGFTVISEICQRLELDCYLEYNEGDKQWYLKTFNKDDITNTSESIAYGINLISLGDYGVDNTGIINRARVYGGQESSNIIVLKTENDTDSQSQFWIKDSTLQAQELTSMDEIQEKADYELSKGIVEVNEGRMTVVGMSTIKPGDNLPVSIPYCGVSGLHRIQQFTHTIGKTFTTTVEVEKEIKTIKDLFIGKVNPDFVTSNSNLNDMTDSYTIFFDEDPSIMALSNTIEVGGKLKLAGGYVTGEATSNIITGDQDSVTECEFRRFENFATEDDIYQVTNDNGVTYETYSTAAGGLHRFTSEGNQVGIKMTLNRNSSTATSPAYESICLLFR